MSAPHYLVAVSIGPVQQMILAARRTRDLWFGSHMLSELAHAAVRLIADSEHRGTMIFPQVDASTAPHVSTQQTLPNKLVFRIACDDPKAIVASIRSALHDRFDLFWQDTLTQISTAVGADTRRRATGAADAVDDWVDCARAEAQIKTGYLEIYAAWASVAFDDSNYVAAYHQLEQSLAARKATRTFAQSQSTGRGGAKSALDGARESVLSARLFQANDAKAIRVRRKLGIDRREGLDALGLIKRVLGRDHSFAAMTRVAIEPWVQRANAKCPTLVADVDAAYEALVSLNEATRAKDYSPLSYDAQYLLNSDRIAIAIEDEREDFGGVGSETNGNRTLAALEALRACLKALRDKMQGDEVVPYVALIKADGDHMGRLLWKNATNDAHKKLSTALNAYVQHAKAVVKQHQGASIYIGADDALVLVPVDHAIDCARALRDCFVMAMSAIKLGEATATLSVGIGIAHVLEPMIHLRALAAQAEKHAKGGLVQDDIERDALGIAIQPRGGGAIFARGQWGSTAVPSFDQRMREIIAAMQAKTLPTGAAAAVADAIRSAGDNMRLIQPLAKRAISRLAASKATDSADGIIPKLLERLDIGSNDFKTVTHNAMRLNNELVLARWLARHTAPEAATESSARNE